MLCFYVTYLTMELCVYFFLYVAKLNVFSINKVYCYFQLLTLNNLIVTLLPSIILPFYKPSFCGLLSEKYILETKNHRLFSAYPFFYQRANKKQIKVTLTFEA